MKDIKTITCPNCGAKLNPNDYESEVKCPYCDTILTNLNYDSDVLDPETIEKFKKEDEETTRKFKKRMKELREEQIKQQALEDKRNLRNGIFFVILLVAYAIFTLVKHMN